MDVLTITQRNISTHMLRGERDIPNGTINKSGISIFQLTRSMGSVTSNGWYDKDKKYFNSHAPRGA